MSQAGIVDIEGSHPQIPTLFVANVGSAIPITNTLEILGSVVDAHGAPIQTVASGNTVNIDVQLASAALSSAVANAGLASFDSEDFTVDANGFVQFSSGVFAEDFQVDTSTPPGTNPVEPSGTGTVSITGGQVAAGTTANVIQTNSLMANMFTIQIQRSKAVSSSTIADNGVSHFNSTYFTVDANGFVATNGSGIGSTITGDSGGALSPTAGNWTFTGGTTGLTFAGAGSTETLGGTLKLANGGTNASLTASNGGIFYSTATAGAILSGTATALQMLQSGASSAPAWSTTTWPATSSINTILYSSSANVIGQITAADNGVLISGTTGIPSWLAAGTTGQVLIATTSNPASWGTLSSIAVTTLTGTANEVLVNGTSGMATSGAITLTTPQAIGTTSSPTFAALTATTSITSPAHITTGTSSGNVTIESATGTYNFVLPTTSGTSGYFLTSAAGGTMTWTQAPSGSVTQYATLVGGASNTIASVGPSATSGAVYIGKGSSTNPAFSTSTTINDSTAVITLTADATSVTPEIICKNTWNTNDGGGQSALFVATAHSSVGQADTGTYCSGQWDTSKYWNFGMCSTASSFGNSYNISYSSVGTEAPEAGTVGLSISTAGVCKISNAYTLPSTAGTNNYVLTTNGTSAASWQPLSVLAFSVNVQVFTTSGTYTPTAGMSYCTIECVGGGGGGGGSVAATSSTVSCGGGGGGGGYGRKTVAAATIGASQTVTIGAGGSGVSGSNGNAGGTTSVGSIVTATGGGGGTNNLATQTSGQTSAGIGGAGGVGTSGDLNAYGGGGGTGIAVLFPAVSVIFVGGTGGISIFGGGGVGAGSYIAGAVNGTSGTAYGGGGGGGACWNSSSAASTGGSGSGGIVIITEYIT